MPHIILHLSHAVRFWVQIALFGVYFVLFPGWGALVTYVLFGIFAVWISRDSMYVSMYKPVSAGFLSGKSSWQSASADRVSGHGLGDLESVFMIGGIEIAVFFFDKNVWADIAGRIVLLGLITWFI